MRLAKIYLQLARRLSHLQTKAQRHAWVRAKLQYPSPRVAISTAPDLGRSDLWRFRRAA